MLDAIASAGAIVIGPSNPVISIGPILELPAIRDALREANAPVVAMSPFVAGEVLKGPTEAFCRMAGLPTGVECMPAAYNGLLDGVVADEKTEALPSHVTDTLMNTPEARERVARETLTFAQTLK